MGSAVSWETFGGEWSHWSVSLGLNPWLYRRLLLPDDLSPEDE